MAVFRDDVSERESVCVCFTVRRREILRMYLFEEVLVMLLMSSR